jgi:protein phosphatase
LHGYLREEEIPIVTFLGAEPAVHRFIEIANDRGGKDNITAILVEVKESSGDRAAS